MSANPRYAHSGQVRIAYHLRNESASVRPLLMIMGLSGVKEDWHDLPERLAQDRPVAVFDNRGIGESDVPDGPYTAEQLAGDALALLDTLRWEQVHVMGISMGGMIAQTLALAV
ncbi:MAG: alpha/beta fold hydrolase, partial [Candidatus Macondimonas sp.]